LGKACSATLAHFVLEERLHVLGIVGCVLCIVGSINIVLYAPQERAIVSVKDVWLLATESGRFLCYVWFDFTNQSQGCIKLECFAATGASGEVLII
jgi:hypothetical protein